MRSVFRLMLLFCMVFLFSASLWAEDVVDLTGTWHGSYHAAFPSGHKLHHETSLEIDMELKVYKQEGNLIWIENRWRPRGTEDRHSEFGTGVLSDWEPGVVNIVETDPSPAVGSTGMFQGKLVDGKMHLVYLGVGRGISFSVTLERK